jgi:hypothetical protein
LRVDDFTKTFLSKDEYNKIKRLVKDKIEPQRVKQTMSVLWDIRKYTISQCYEFDRLPPDFDDSLETWLDGTSYTQADKDIFKKEIEMRSNLLPMDCVCKCFIKAETYPEFKYPRPIKSRTNRFKAVMGPIFQGINNIMFSKTKYFVKKIPVAERARWLSEIFGLIDPDDSDYTTFEAHFIELIMYIIEYPFYAWCVWDLHQKQKFLDNLHIIMSTNKCIFNDFTVYSESRASGEMNTSLGNGWCNKIITIYIAVVKSAVKTDAAFEGDDGLSASFPRESRPTTKDFDDLGWNCKFHSNPNFSEASFCGIVSDPVDQINVCDVRAYLADFGWTRNQYCWANDKTHRALIRAKGYSAIYQYPGCPIIDALGHYALRITNTEEVQRKMLKMFRAGQLADSRYKNFKFQMIFDKLLDKLPERCDSPPNTRLLVEKKFSVPVGRQIEIEQYLDRLMTRQPLQVNIEVPEVWTVNNDMYVNNYPEPTPRKQFEELLNNLAKWNLL